MHSHSHTMTRAPRAPRAAGFTLLELLLVIAVIFVLVGMILFGLRSGKAAADRTVSLNALRQIMTGYSNYSTEHNGRLLPGCVNPAVLGTPVPPQLLLDLKAETKAGAVLNAADTSGYVWRLAPYLNHGYSALTCDYSKGLQKRYEDEIAEGVYGPGTVGPNQLGIGLTPSIGYNSIYLGGDNVHGGHTTSYSPWGWPDPNVPNPTIAAFRLSEIQYPTKTVAFATCKAVNMTLPEVGEQLGYVELRPPWIPGEDAAECDSKQWAIDDNNQLQPYPENFSERGGLMVDRAGGRAGDKVPTSRIDGSVGHVNPMEYFEDQTLPNDQWIYAIKKVIAQWSPVYARGHGVAP